MQHEVGPRSEQVENELPYAEFAHANHGLVYTEASSFQKLYACSLCRPWIAGDDPNHEGSPRQSFLPE